MSDFDTSDYERLLCDFLEGRASAPQHAVRFFERFQQEARTDLPEPVFLVLNWHQSTCEMFTDDPDLLTNRDDFDVDEPELRRGAAEALVRLRSACG